MINAKDWRLTNDLAWPFFGAALEALIPEYRKQFSLKYILNCTMAKALEKFTLFSASLTRGWFCDASSHVVLTRVGYFYKRNRKDVASVSAQNLASRLYIC